MQVQPYKAITFVREGDKLVRPAQWPRSHPLACKEPQTGSWAWTWRGTLSSRRMWQWPPFDQIWFCYPGAQKTSLLLSLQYPFNLWGLWVLLVQTGVPLLVTELLVSSRFSGSPTIKNIGWFSSPCPWLRHWLTSGVGSLPDTRCPLLPQDGLNAEYQLHLVVYCMIRDQIHIEKVKGVLQQAVNKSHSH